jgi:hypothetical protein
MTPSGGALASGERLSGSLADGPQSASVPERGDLDKSRLVEILGAVALAIPVAAHFWFIHRYGVNMIWNDAWTDINVIEQAHKGNLSLAVLWQQHTENRILFPNLIVVALAYTTHYNVIVEEYLSGVMLVATTALLIMAHRRRAPGMAWLSYLPVVVLMFTFVGGNLYYGSTSTLFGFAMSWYLALMAMAVSLFLLDRWAMTSVVLAAAIAAAVVGSYSSIQGLFIWPVGLVLLLLRGRTKRAVVSWVVAGVATAALFFYHYNVQAGNGGLSYGLSHPLPSLKFFLFSVGDNIMGQQLTRPPSGWGDLDLLLGIAVAVVAVWVLVSFGTRRDDASARPLGVAITWLGLLFALAVTVSRAGQGFWQTPRFAMFEVLLWVGCYLALLGRPSSTGDDGSPSLVEPSGVESEEGIHPAAPFRQREAVNRLVIRFLVLVIIVQAVLGVPSGLKDARTWHQEELVAADVTVNVGQVPDGLLQAAVGQWPPGYIRQLADFARTDRLSLFATPMAASYRRQGLLPSVATAVVAPTDGAVVSGTTVLDARSLYHSPGTTVQFRLSRTAAHDTLIGRATGTNYGYVLHWGTTTVPNGWYQLSSEVVRPDGALVRSTPIWIDVVNRA